VIDPASRADYFKNGLELTMRYRAAEKNDIEAINGILTASFDSVYAFFARKSIAGLENVIVAEDENRLNGVINYRIFDSGNGKIGYLYYLAVHPDDRRKGIGKRLIREATRRIDEEAGPVDVYAAAERSNRASKRLLERIGFAVISRSDFRKKYGGGRLRLSSMMNLMPWEELYVTRPR
jgi:ribosomal protein S18 acetylase RimI-like enzyme